MKIPRQCAILVGGHGTRLGTLTANIPKPLLECGDRPFLAWVLRELVRFGIEEVVLLAGYRSEYVEDFCHQIPSWVPKPLSVKISIEPSPAGTGGAIWYARRFLRDSFLLINGDSWLDTNLARFFAAVATAENIAGSVLLCAMDDCMRYGTAEVCGDRITVFRDRSSVVGSGLISSGIYAFNREIFALLSSTCSLEKDILPVLARQGRLAAVMLDGYFIDIGIPADYTNAGRELPQRLTRPAVFFYVGTRNEDPHRVDSSDRLHWILGARDALRLVNDAGMHVFVVTHHAGVGREFCIESDVERLREQILQYLLHHGATIDDIYFCPIHTSTILNRYGEKLDWREPSADVIGDFIENWGIDIGRSVLVVD